MRPVLTSGVVKFSLGCHFVLEQFLTCTCEHSVSHYLSTVGYLLEHCQMFVQSCFTSALQQLYFKSETLPEHAFLR